MAITPQGDRIHADNRHRGAAPMTTGRREPDDPCDRTAPHRNWQSDRVGICPGRRAALGDDTPAET